MHLIIALLILGALVEYLPKLLPWLLVGVVFFGIDIYLGSQAAGAAFMLCLAFIGIAAFLNARN